MIIAFHMTWTTYGHWFPNDPRGSWSDEVWNPKLTAVRALDDGHRVKGPRPVSKVELQAFLDSARPQLRWNVVQLNQTERQSVVAVIDEVACAMNLTVRACAALSNHVHLVVDRSSASYERIVSRVKGRSSQAVRKLRDIPAALARRDRIPVWTRGYWCRYINTAPYMKHAIRYVQRHAGRTDLEARRSIDNSTPRSQANCRLSRRSHRNER